LRILCFYLLFIASNFHSQINEISSPNFGLRFEIKNFFLESTRFKIQEIKPYFEYNQNIKIGLGYCWLKNNKHHFKDSDSSLISIKSSNFFVSYNWVVSKNFFAEVTLDLGLGNIKSLLPDNSRYKGTYSFLEPAIILNYEGFNFFTLGLGSGLRLTRSDKSVLRNNLSLPTIILRFSIKFTEIYNHFFLASNSSLYLQDDRRV
jgi:hypothetical protein|tara:strand:- start:193 stop:804 length:612 start_codon:yes stop_codon:yes gene_type:complete